MRSQDTERYLKRVTVSRGLSKAAESYVRENRYKEEWSFKIKITIQRVSLKEALMFLFMT